MSGSCAVPNDALTFKEDCDALGTCASGAATENECGTCSDSSATKANACATVAGTWTADVWTPTGTWELSAAEVCQPPSPEFHPACVATRPRPDSPSSASKP